MLNNTLSFSLPCSGEEWLAFGLLLVLIPDLWVGISIGIQHWRKTCWLQFLQWLPCLRPRGVLPLFSAKINGWTCFRIVCFAEVTTEWKPSSNTLDLMQIHLKTLPDNIIFHRHIDRRRYAICFVRGELSSIAQHVALIPVGIPVLERLLYTDIHFNILCLL